MKHAFILSALAAVLASPAFAADVAPIGASVQGSNTTDTQKPQPAADLSTGAKVAIGAAVAGLIAATSNSDSSTTHSSTTHH